MEKYVSHLSLREVLSDYRRVVSSPCPHVDYFKRALQIWGWQTSIGLDDIANLYIHSLSVAVNEAAVWLAGFSQANRCLHLHVWKDLIWLGSDKKCSENWQGSHQNSKLSSVYWTYHVFVFTADLTSRKELLISGTKSDDVNLLLPTVYIWECYQHLLWPCPLSIPSQAHRGPWPTQWCLSARRPIATHPTGAKTRRSFWSAQTFSKDMWSNQTYTHLLRSLGLSLLFVENV